MAVCEVDAERTACTVDHLAVGPRIDLVFAVWSTRRTAWRHLRWLAQAEAHIRITGIRFHRREQPMPPAADIRRGPHHVPGELPLERHAEIIGVRQPGACGDSGRTGNREEHRPVDIGVTRSGQRTRKALPLALAGSPIDKRGFEHRWLRAEPIQTKRRVANFDEQLAVINRGEEPAPRSMNAGLAGAANQRAERPPLYVW